MDESFSFKSCNELTLTNINETRPIERHCSEMDRPTFLSVICRTGGSVSTGFGAPGTSLTDMARTSGMSGLFRQKKTVSKYICPTSSCTIVVSDLPSKKLLMLCFYWCSQM